MRQSLLPLHMQQQQQEQKMLLKIEVPNAAPVDGVTKGGTPYKAQTCYAFTTDQSGEVAKYPQRMKVEHYDGQEPYKPGFYELLPSSLYVDKYGRLAVSRRPLLKAEK